MSREEIAIANAIEKELNEVITKYGFESEPTIYYATNADKSPRNHSIYYEVAMNWHFDWEEEE